MTSGFEITSTPEEVLEMREFEPEDNGFLSSRASFPRKTCFVCLFFFFQKKVANCHPQRTIPEKRL